MRIEREILNAQMLGGLVVGKIVEQDRAQNRALSFYVGGNGTHRVIGRGHGAIHTLAEFCPQHKRIYDEETNDFVNKL